MPETADQTYLRMKLGERIPAGGTESDTLFTAQELQSFIDTSSSLEGAVLEGWEAKRASLANLVSVTDGAASRELSDAFAHANEMVEYYSRKNNGRSGRTRIGSITRS